MLDYYKFNQIIDHISLLMRKVMNERENRFDIDSEYYRRHLFTDFCTFMRYLPNKESRILDLGCGKGHHTAALSGLGYHNIRGLDLHLTTGEGGIYNTESLGAQWQKNLWKVFESSFSIKYNFYEGNKIPFEDDSFDAILLYAVIEHVDYPNQFLRECKRVIKKGGKLFIYRCPNRFSYTENLAKLLKLPSHEKMYKKNELTLLFKQVGFKQILLERYDHFPSFCPIEKLQSLFDVTLSILSKLDFLFSFSLLNHFSHHYRGIYFKMY